MKDKYCVDTMGNQNEVWHSPINFVIVHTYRPESNEYVKGIAIARELDVSSMGIASVPLNVIDQPESLG